MGGVRVTERLDQCGNADVTRHARWQRADQRVGCFFLTVMTTIFHDSLND